MANMKKAKLSGGAVGGKPIDITQTVSPGTVIHTATSSTTDFDELVVYLFNSGASSKDVTIEMGGTAAKDQMVINLPANSGKILVIDRSPFNNSVVIRAFKAAAGPAAQISAIGHIHEIR